MSNSHANWLRRAAEEIAKAGHNGWGNTCEGAAEHIDALEAELAALRAELEVFREREAATAQGVRWLENESKRIERRAERAEAALLRKGYRMSCDIPACNCGDQWTHGGHAEMRLTEIREALEQADARRNGETLLADVVHIAARAERATTIEAELAALRAELAVLRNNQLGPVPEGPLKALGAWVADHTDDDTWPNAERYLNAALAEMEALRERVARLVGENDAITDLNQTQFLELEHLRRISSAAYRLHDESEEYEFDDGLGRGAPQDLWDALSTAIDTMTDAQRTALGER